MNKLLALSVALLSVSLYGAEKSLNGLEGFAKTALTKAQLVELIEELNKDGLEGFSKDGLEGINKGDLNVTNFERSVIVVDYSLSKPPRLVYKPFDAKAIKDQVELRLRQSKLELANTSGYLWVKAVPILTLEDTLYAYSLTIHAKRKVTFEANGKTYFKTASVWEDGYTAPPRLLQKVIDMIMDKFFKDYHKANPKKKE